MPAAKIPEVRGFQIFLVGLKTQSVRGVAQPGSASVLGTEGREFESLRPDHFTKIDVSSGAALGAAASAGMIVAQLCARRL